MPSRKSAVPISRSCSDRSRSTMSPNRSTRSARSVRRIDFLSAPGDSLSLLTGNSAAGSPSYDLALLAGALLALPAQPAHLEPARDIAPAHAPPAKWFWVAVIVAGLGVAAALARALGTPRRA